MINLDPNSNDPPMTSNSDESIFNLIKENDIEGVNSLLSSKSDEVHATDKNVSWTFHRLNFSVIHLF
ncbi:unnamed protein product [Trichobilharzia regenti]|nr:unnamed protein product [Trichobilharzia regenti]